MAVWKKNVAGFIVKIFEVDHPPPHCHIFIHGRSLKVSLFSLDIMNPPPHKLPPNLRRGLLRHQDSLLCAWERVNIVNPGKYHGGRSSR